MIHITEQAAKQLRTLAAEKMSSEKIGLRLAIEKGGCAGLQYSMILGPGQLGDELFDREGAIVFVEAASLPQFEECTLDYEDGLTGSGFRIMNPRAVRSCGCGTSFEPKKEKE
ncbi:MAG: hypothetical protein A3F67_02415 [Verrucomicrobia bacterium RIFCSPHIGHO2_12_FULL_41_10]|nr:MAG: hypothetical protein A3F67_02415 [Verrucomicrobia bacterium RIFCSPHIGHO2_12_FULL_41_10]HLB32942.1 iron-sulfur cluster assembly accessory protein [Chthoniobacterales bacterium]